MDGEQRGSIDSLLEQVLSRAEAERERFLSEACRGDEGLYLEISSLLRSHERAGLFLEGSDSLETSIQRAFGLRETTLVPGEVLAGRFEIRKIRARGGMGEVYEAFDRELKEAIALKTIRPEFALDPAAIDRLKREVRLSRRVSHPNVCRVHDVFQAWGPDGEDTFLTMELLGGESLAARLDREGRIEWREGLPILIQILAGLEAAASANLVHRDLKPENVMLVPDEAGLRAVVTDFGLARLADTPVSGEEGRAAPISAGGRRSSRSAWGTPAYMSPEQLRGEPVTQLSDVFSFGVIAYEVLAGKHPYPIENGSVPLGDRFGAAPASIRNGDRSLPASLKMLVRECLAVEPALRASDLRNLKNRFEKIPAEVPARRTAILAGLSAAGGALLLVGHRADVLGSLGRYLNGPRVLAIEEHVDSATAQQALRRGMGLIADGENLNAIAVLQTASGDTSAPLLVQSVLADALLNVGDYKTLEEMKDSLRTAEVSALPVVGPFASAMLARANADYGEASRILCSLSDEYPDDLYLLLSCARVAEESGDIRSATNHYNRAVRRSRAVLLGLGRCLTTTGHVREASELISASLGSGQLGNAPEVLGMAHSILGVAKREQGRIPEAASHHQRALHYREEASDQRGVVASMSHLGSSLRALGRFSDSIRILEQALDVSRATSDLMYESLALHTLAMSYQAAGRVEDAMTVERQSLDIELSRGDHTEIPVRLNFLANLHRTDGRYAEADVLLAQAMEHVHLSGDRSMESLILLVQAHVQRERGRYENAIETLQRCVRLIQDVRESSVAETRAIIAGIYDRKGDHAETCRIGLQALGSLGRMEPGGSSVEVRLWHAHHLSLMGDFAQARSVLNAAVEVAERIREEELLLQMAILNGKLTYYRGSLEGAAVVFESALAKSQALGFEALMVESRVLLGRTYLRLGRYREASGMLHEAKSVASVAKMNPLLAESERAFAELMLKREKFSEALRSSSRALQISILMGAQPLVRAAHSISAMANSGLTRWRDVRVSLKKGLAVHQMLLARIAEEHHDAYRRHPETVEVLNRFESCALEMKNTSSDLVVRP